MKKQDWAERYFNFLVRFKVPFHLLLLVVTGLSLFLASKLELRTDFAELLPDQLNSVRDIKEADRRLGGTSQLIVGIIGPEFQNNRRFADDLAKKLDPLVGKELRFYEYRYRDVQDYAERYALHYLNVEQLKRLKTRLEGKIQKAADSSVGGFLGLDDDAEKPGATKVDDADVSLFQDIAKDSAFDANVKAFFDYREAYLSAENGKVLAMTLKPQGSALGLGGKQKLVDDVKAMVAELNPKSYDPRMQVVFTGSVPDTLREIATIRDDIVGTSVMLTSLILLLLWIFFWSFRVIGLLIFNLLFGVAWTFGVTQFHIGYLNTQTAFMGSLVVGTGINYGIIIVSRYLELRRAGTELRDAVIEAMRSTLVATLIASLTTIVSFASLFLAENKGFSQFGFMGGVGILFCWSAAFSVLPLWIYLLEKWRPSKRLQNPIAVHLHGFGVRFGEGIVRRAALVAIVLVGVSVVAAFGFARLAKAPLEYNFDNVRNRFSTTSEEEALNQRVYEAFPSSLTPSAVFTDNEADARAVCPEVRRMIATLPEERNAIYSCLSLYDLLPPAMPQAQRPEQQRLFREIRDILGRKAIKFSEHADLVGRFRERMSFVPPQLNDVPDQIQRRFQEKDGRVGLISYVNPSGRKPLNDGRNLLNFTGELSKLAALPGAKGRVFVAGDSFVLADLLRGIQRDGPKISAIAFGGVVVVAMALSGSFTSGLLMAFCLVVATWWMLGFQGWVGIKYNFFNFIALPLTFGIGVDYPVNVFVRCRQEGFRGYGRIFAGSGMAVMLCSLTTFIGYYTLLGGASLALEGFGKLGLIGETACLVTALLVVPVVLRAFGRFRDDRAHLQQ